MWIKLEYLPVNFWVLKTDTNLTYLVFILSSYCLFLSYWALLSTSILKNRGRDCMQHASRITITCRIQATCVASVEASQAKSCQAGQWRIAHPHLLEIFKYGAPPYISAIRQTSAPTLIQHQDLISHTTVTVIWLNVKNTGCQLRIWNEVFKIHTKINIMQNYIWRHLYRLQQHYCEIFL